MTFTLETTQDQDDALQRIVDGVNSDNKSALTIEDYLKARIADLLASYSRQNRVKDSEYVKQAFLDADAATAEELFKKADEINSNKVVPTPIIPLPPVEVHGSDGPPPIPTQPPPEETP